MNEYNKTSAIDKQSPIPVYHQLTTVLRERILDLDWPQGSKLPTENELAEGYGVSRVTVRQALNTLENEGLIKRIRGSGAYVQKVHKPVVHDFSLPSTLCAKLGQRGISLQASILDLEELAPIPSINSTLKLASTQPLTYIRRLFRHDETIIALNESWISAELVPEIREKGLINDHLSVTLSSRYNLSPISIQNTIEAVRLSAQDMQAMQVDYDAPMISVTSVSYLPYNVPLEYSRTLWRGDQVKFSFDMNSQG